MNRFKEAETVDDLKTLLEEYGASGSDYGERYRHYMEDNRVEIGGLTGASCWDEAEPHPYSTGETLSESDGALFTALKSEWKDMGFFEFRSLMDAVTHEYTDKIGDYYGNSSDYRVRVVDIEKLLEYLHEHRD